MSKIDINKSWKYDESPESTSHINLKDKYELFIGGEFVKPLSKKYFNTLNPATNQSIAKIADANDKDIDKAVKSARKAFKSWSKLDSKERGKYIFRIARMIQERAKEFAVIESMDGGKPIRESRDIDIPLAANHFFYHAGWADKLEYAFPNKTPKPLGVAGQIIPWNFPFIVTSERLPFILSAGNAAIIKPSEFAAQSILFLILLLRAKPPPQNYKYNDR